MEMKRITGGRLRAAGYDARTRRLRVELDDGSLLEYDGVGEEIWRRLNGAAPWSVFRDLLEEEYTGRRVGRDAPAGRNPLDDLFG